jgi:hypothetical protein
VHEEHKKAPFKRRNWLENGRAFSFVSFLPAGYLAGMANTVRFTTKGQVVIPLRLRKEFHIPAAACST